MPDLRRGRHAVTGYPGKHERATRRARAVAEPRTVECRGRCGGQAAVLDAVCPACLAEAPANLVNAYERSRVGPANLPVRFAAEDAIAAWLIRARRGAVDEWPAVG